MNEITVKYINLGGIGFTVNSENSYEKRKVYKLKLKAVLPDKDVETCVKIAVIEISEDGFRAIYRDLTDVQTAALEEISIFFAKGFLNNERKLFASISE